LLNIKPEDHIIKQLAQGNPLVFEGVFKTHYKELILHALRFVEDEEEAEEIVQALFLDIWNKRAELQINTSLRSYLYTSVRNTCLNFIKHKKVEYKYKEHNAHLITEESGTEKDSLVQQELAEKIDQAISKLPPERQKVFKMSRYEGLKYKEIAEQMNISVKTVENQMGKALKFLREELVEFLPLLFIFFRQFYDKG